MSGPFKSALLVGLLFALLPVMLCAAAAEPPAEATRSPAIEQARRLVQRLASSNYAEREAASQRLVRLGWRAKPALEEGLRNPHAETRLRVQRILSVIEQQDFQRTLDEFLADDEGEKDHNLPTWPRFREEIGHDLPARQLFVTMLKAEGDLLTAVAANPRAAAELFQLRCQQLQVESAADSREIPAGSLAAVFYVASDQRVPMPAGTDSLLYRFCNHSSVEDSLEKKGEDSLMRRLVAAWIGSGRGGYYALRLAMAHEIKQGLAAAETMLDEQTPSYYRQYAILTFAKLGTKEDIPKLKKLLEDDDVCTTHRVNNETYQTQFRDIALVAVLHLYGQNPQMYGFERIRPHSQYVYSPYSMGFKSDEERQKAFDRWENFSRRLMANEKPAEE